MFTPFIQKNLSNSYLRIFPKSIQSFSYNSIANNTHINKYKSNNKYALINNNQLQFKYITTKAQQTEIKKRQHEMQMEHKQKMESKWAATSQLGQSEQYAAVYPDDLSDDEDEYIPEADWDHTRFESHYKRIWESEPESESFREKIYNKLLITTVGGTWIIGAGCFLFGVFAWYKMKRQLKYVRKTQRSIRYIRKIYDKNIIALTELIPFDFSTMNVTDIKDQLVSMDTIDGTHISLDTLNEWNIWKKLLELEIPVNDMIDYEGNGILDIEDITYFICMLHYFLGQPRRKGTPSVRRRVRDDIYKMLQTYNSDNDNVTLKNMGSYACACFCLAMISPPQLGDEKIGGQTLDEFKVNYCKYMLRDEDMTIDSHVTTRKFNFLYKVCDFSIGLTPETRGQLAK